MLPGLSDVARPTLRWLDDSPLPYRHRHQVRRLALVDPSAGVAPRHHKYYQDPELVGFLDYHLVGDDYVYIDYVHVRHDQRRKKYARKLVDSLFARYAEMDTIDFGHIHDDALEKLYFEKRALEGEGVPYVRGKLF